MQEYYIVFADINLDALVSVVNSRMHAGWKLAGGICVVVEKLNKDLEPDPNGKENTVYYQAMSKI